MTKEELEKEAEKYLDEKCKDCYMCSYDEHKDPYRVCQRRKDRKQAYLAGAEPREKRIAELEAQIEKMKCCGNCENRYGQEKCADCHKYSKWKFKQAEQFYEEIAD